MGKYYIDMHIHSTNSDGILTPEQIVEEANKNNVGVLSITDHDFLLERKKYKSLTIGNKSIKLIPGAELSTDYYVGDKKIRIHLLSYDAIDKNGDLMKAMINMKNARTEGNYAYIQMLLKKLKFLDSEDFKDFDYSKYGWLKKRILNTININKYKKEEVDILIKCLEQIKPIYRKCTLDIEEGIDLIKKAEGFSSFAHPYQTKLPYNELEKMVSCFKSMGIDAIETFHAMADKQDNDLAKDLANKYNLLESCGSDFHTFGIENRKQIGLGLYNNMCIEQSSLADEIIHQNKFYSNGEYMREER